ncbi:hypothetical protein [Heyndrickxia ginsengihumi]|uniref:Uncharacterized protein n=1 Tax=Heyndrickxia ginsengihumi TaxID=363870 RepID=A0A6M0PAL0_9BACI|nr:hypothetical protein [Heyndrickxia ginsengihumi]MBE6185388.1 hypothetical protein [Bacillus sp. (in: firmicutes)]MCM3023538.1 hypothetical protein [Heyndrickxia ginsengihumi]NEY20308.1 hypothetical protein [Heyndrickxia ginsengihumi]
MVVIQYFDNTLLVLTQLVRQIPSVGDDIKIKGRKGKVISVTEMEGNIVRINVAFEKIIKKQSLLLDNKKKRK